jgi:uncharacterized membrane protein YphA (DoxX/SURF4 family)
VKLDAKSAALALVRIALGVTFAYAAATKLPNMQQFAEETANYRILPAALVPLFSVMVAGVEIFSGAMLVVGAMVRAAASIVGALLVVFIIALSAALMRGIDLRCGCFGGAELASWGTVWRDVVMLAAALLVLKFGGGRLLPRRAVQTTVE